jgi:hypothetical protein
MNAIERIEHIRKTRGLRRNKDGVFEADMAIFNLLKAFDTMREIAKKFHDDYFQTRSYPVKPGSDENIDRLFNERMEK